MDKDQTTRKITFASNVPIQRSFVSTQLSVTKVAIFLLVTVSLSFDQIKSNLNVFSRFKHSHRDGNFSELAGHCTDITPISEQEFHDRQQSLVETLHVLNASAYVAESGPSSNYYANISGWGLSERPFLLIISPQIDGTIVKPNVSVLTPYFEKTRAQLMTIPSTHPVTFVSWREEENPYEIATSAILSANPTGPIFADGELRTFILDGLSKALSSSYVSMATVEIQRLRQRKSARELEIMKCSNEVTLLAVRAVRKRMYIGMSQLEAEQLITRALSAAGLTNIEVLVLFGEDAARPHGGGEKAVLRDSDLVLIDTGGALHHYYSDLTRTFALPSTTVSPRQLQVWYDVQEAQTVALMAAKNGTLTEVVDEAARAVLKSKGLSEYFTHRLGHGIGMEMHESPYLCGGSKDVILSGHTFSDEPGVYIEGEFGIRLEDSFYIDDDGNGVYLTEGVGGQASSPWEL